MQAADPELGTDAERRTLELRAFLFLVVALAPAITVALIGGLGLGIWVFQMIVGPPGPPPG